MNFLIGINKKANTDTVFASKNKEKTFYFIILKNYKIYTDRYKK